MSSQSEGSTITQWIINAGGGTDPSWAASTVRFLLALFGVWYLHDANVDYGSLTYPARLAASAATALFGGSLLVKIVKSSANASQRSNRMARAQKHWDSLSRGEHEVISKFMSGKRRRLTLEETDPPTIGPLVEVGVLKDVYRHHSDADWTGPSDYELSEGMWDLAVSLWERDKFRTNEVDETDPDETLQLLKTAQEREKAAQDRAEQLAHDLKRTKGELNAARVTIPNRLHGGGLTTTPSSPLSAEDIASRAIYNSPNITSPKDLFINPGHQSDANALGLNPNNLSVNLGYISPTSPDANLFAGRNPPRKEDDEGDDK